MFLNLKFYPKILVSVLPKRCDITNKRAVCQLISKIGNRSAGTKKAMNTTALTPFLKGDI